MANSKKPQTAKNTPAKKAAVKKTAAKKAPAKKQAAPKKKAEPKAVNEDTALHEAAHELHAKLVDPIVSEALSKVGISFDSSSDNEIRVDTVKAKGFIKRLFSRPKKSK